MNQPVYNPAFYSPPPYPPQPVQPAPGTAPQPYPPQPVGYGGYPPQGAGYPAAPAGALYVPYVPAPPAGPRFSAAPQKDPRKSGGRRAVNLMSLLILLQALLSVGIQLAVMGVSAVMGSTLLYTDELAYTWFVLAMSPLSTALPFFVYMLVGKKDWSRYLRFEKTGFFTGLLLVFASLGLCLLADYPAYAIEVLLESLGASSASAAAPQISSMEGFWLELAGVAVLVPVLEEFAFRGALLSGLRRYGTGFAVAASGLLFGMAHMTPSSVVFASLAGLVMGFLYAKTNNLWLTVAVHALNNALSVVLSNANLLFPSQTAALLLDVLPLGLIGLGMLSLVLLLIFRRQKVFGRREPDMVVEAQPALGPGEAIGCMVKAPMFWGVVGMTFIGAAMLFL